MNIILGARTQKLLEEELKSGGYHSAEDTLHAALIALREAKDLQPDAATLDAIDRAEDQIDRGDYQDWSTAREAVRAKFIGK